MAIGGVETLLHRTLHIGGMGTKFQYENPDLALGIVRFSILDPQSPSEPFGFLMCRTTNT